jgi:protein involved in polysaccharide export with SLBB domain
MTFFVKGIFSVNQKLRSGDVIFVNPVNSLVRISGGVKKPGLYELLKNESLESLFDIAGGFSELANTSDIKFEDFKSGSIISNNINLNDFSEIVPGTGANIFINEYKFSTVKITGAVKNPGTYSISNNDKLSQLIIRAGGYLENSYPMGGVLLNENAKEIEIRNNKQSYKNLISYVVSSLFSTQSTTTPDASAIGYLLQEIKNVEPTGRLQAEFDLLTIKEDTSKDTFLEHGDQLHIPNFSQQVYVFGEVGNAGAVRFDPNADAKDYIMMAGGFNKQSDQNNTFIVHPSGSSQSIAKK